MIQYYIKLIKYVEKFSKFRHTMSNFKDLFLPLYMILIYMFTLTYTTDRIMKFKEHAKKTTIKTEVTILPHD